MQSLDTESNTKGSNWKFTEFRYRGKQKKIVCEKKNKGGVGTEKVGDLI